MSQELIAAGHSTDLFDNLPSPDFTCGICMEVLNNPHQCKNGHCYCLWCITQALTVRQECPTCKVPLSKGTLSANLIVRNVIDMLPVKCVNGCEEKKCDWKGTIESLPTHLKTECQFVAVDCPWVLLKCCGENCPKKLCSYQMHDHVISNRHLISKVGTSPHPSDCYMGVYTREFGSFVFRKSNSAEFYSGTWLHGKRHGYGVAKTAATEYFGEWKDNKQCGRALVIYPDFGDEYSGQVRNGMKHGVGTYNFFEGDVYSGEFANDKLEGQGEYRSVSEGYTHTGRFKNNSSHGEGMRVLIDGTVIEGKRLHKTQHRL